MLQVPLLNLRFYTDDATCTAQVHGHISRGGGIKQHEMHTPLIAQKKWLQPCTNSYLSNFHLVPTRKGIDLFSSNHVNSNFDLFRKIRVPMVSDFRHSKPFGTIE